jgi:ribose transport system ATP-binding protein
MRQPLLALTGVSKSFGGERALDAASLEIAPGEVHGLLGQNGSGKSTLLKVLSGFHAPDEGSLTVRGEEVGLPLVPGSFHDLGMAFVHQDLALAPGLSVTENVIVSRLISPRIGHVSWRREHRRVREMLERYGLASISPRRPVGELTPMQQAMLAIARAVEELRVAGHDLPLLVLDEPTAFLPRAGIEELFNLVRMIVADGGSVLLVSHDLAEVREICDRVTVLRDGRVAGTAVVTEVLDGELIEMITGYRVEPAAHTPREVGGLPPALVARGVGGDILDDLDFELHKGEVLGVTGLIGSGFEELAPVLFGARPGRGQLVVNERTIDLEAVTPAAAIAHGLVFVPADRQREAVIGELSVTDNVTMTSLARFRTPLRLSRSSMRVAAGELVVRFNVQPARPAMKVSALSGGNQQKAVMAKWMQTTPDVLLLNAPTQGVDVGAREQIYEAIKTAAAAGSAVLCASADYDELASVCDRVIVFARGALVAELTGAQIEKKRIAEHVLTSTTLTSGAA